MHKTYYSIVQYRIKCICIHVVLRTKAHAHINALDSLLRFAMYAGCNVQTEFTHIYNAKTRITYAQNTLLYLESVCVYVCLCVFPYILHTFYVFNTAVLAIERDNNIKYVVDAT